MKKEIYLLIINILMLLLALSLITFYWSIEGNLRWIGLIGYALIGWKWDKESIL